MPISLPRTLIAVVYGTIFVLQALRPSQQPPADTQQGYDPDRPLLNLLSWISAAAILLYVVGLAPGWSLMSLTLLASLTGYTLLLLGFVVWLWARLSLGASWSQDVLASPLRGFVVSGPYQYVRHPMYLSFLMLSTGTLLVSRNVAVGAPFILYSLFVLRRVQAEDSLLARVLGTEYEAYILQTGRLLPKIGKKTHSKTTR